MSRADATNDAAPETGPVPNFGLGHVPNFLHPIGAYSPPHCLKD